MKTRTARTIIGAVTAVLAGVASRAVASSGGREDSSDFVIWGFLSFCALIIVGQLLPALVSFMSAKRLAQRRIQEQLAVSGENRQAEPVFDEGE